jgi:hypothetical protein
MRFFSKLASAAYVCGIFLLAGSPVVERLGQFNPYSLLHIPLYGILTLLLILSFPPQRKRFINPTNSTDSGDTSNSSNLVVAGIIALVVAIADEIYQSFISFRDASVTDVFLDLIGVLLALFLILYLYRKKKHSPLSFDP